MSVESELINRGLTLKPSGKDYVLTNCPFPDHEDKNPSFSINIKTGNFICFGCGESGDFYDLISVLDDISVSEAHRKYRNFDNESSSIFGMLSEILENEEKKYVYYSKKSFFKVFPAIAKGSVGYDYLKKRKLKDSTIHNFDLRWGGNVYHFVNRVIIPVYSPEGKLITYTGRAINNNPVKTRKTRSASKTLFGLNRLLEYTKNKNKVYIVVVEGEFDAMYLQQFNIPAVASMGKHLSDYQIYLLRKYGKKIIMSYDGDKAGVEAMWGKHNNLVRLKKYVPAYGIHLPDGKDPNDLTKEEVYKFYGKYIR